MLHCYTYLFDLLTVPGYIDDIVNSILQTSEFNFVCLKNLNKMSKLPPVRLKKNRK